MTAKEGIQPIVRNDPIRLAVLISGGGSTMQHLAEQIQAQQLHATLAVVISSNEKAGGVERAQAMNLPTFVVPRKAYDSPELFTEHVFGPIRDARVDLVCLAGFLSLLPIPEDYTHQVINIHPALLPAFGGQGMYGRHVHEAVLHHGCKVTGCTVHFADHEYDRGPILVQRACDVHEDDTVETLAKRVQHQERIAYPHAIRLIAEKRITIAEGRAHIHSPDAEQ